MKITFYTKPFQFEWYFLGDEFIDPESGLVIGLHVRFKKHERGWFLRFGGTLRWATVRYDYFYNGKRTGWMVQSPVTRVY